MALVWRHMTKLRWFFDEVWTSNRDKEFKKRLNIASKKQISSLLIQVKPF